MSAIDHLTPELWQRATRNLLAKAIGEFAHERLLVPVKAGSSKEGSGKDGEAYSLAAGADRYRFAAHRFKLDHWVVDPASIERVGRHGRGLELDAADFFLSFRGELGLSDAVLPVYLEEVAATMNRGAYQIGEGQPSAAALVDAGFQAIEAAMTGGHPCFVAGSGRLGFSSEDYRAYAPETGAGVRLMWLAARREHAMFAASPELDFGVAPGHAARRRLAGVLRVHAHRPRFVL